MKGQVNRNYMPCARNNKHSPLTEAKILKQGHNTISKGKDEERGGGSLSKHSPQSL